MLKLVNLQGLLVIFAVFLNFFEIRVGEIFQNKKLGEQIKEIFSMFLENKIGLKKGL